MMSHKDKQYTTRVQGYGVLCGLSYKVCFFTPWGYICVSCNMNTRDFPDMYIAMLKAQGLRVYIPGKSQVLTLQLYVIHITSTVFPVCCYVICKDGNKRVVHAVQFFLNLHVKTI